MTFALSRRQTLAALAAAGGLGWFGAPSDHSARAACCYFSAKNKDVQQPSQRVFLQWDPERQREAFTVQPKFEGNASDFGMVIPTPSQPKLDEMPRDFFRALAVFTILEPMPLDKYKKFPPSPGGGFGGAGRSAGTKSSVLVLEQGIVGSLDYKIVRAEDASDLYRWLEEHQYNYSGGKATLDDYIQRKWLFTVMKIDPQQMRTRPDGSYEGHVTPTRFSFASKQPIYPLRITRISIKEKTEALFYIQAPRKMDLPGALSYQCTWQPMWVQAMRMAVERTNGEKSWLNHVQPYLRELQQHAAQLWKDHYEPATLEWAKKISENDLAVIDGQAPYNREAPAEDVRNLKILRGHIQEGQVLTKIRKVFAKREMRRDLVLTEATVGDERDVTDYYQILPTSPP